MRARIDYFKLIHGRTLVSSRVAFMYCYTFIKPVLSQVLNVLNEYETVLKTAHKRYYVMKPLIAECFEVADVFSNCLHFRVPGRSRFRICTTKPNFVLI